MATLNDNTPEWGPGITRVETTDAVLGGDPTTIDPQTQNEERNSPVNYALQEVNNRLTYLRALVQGIVIPVIYSATEAVKGILQISTDAQAKAGTDDTTAMTPLKTKTAIETLVPQATTAKKGVVEIATTAEVQAGSPANRVLTVGNTFFKPADFVPRQDLFEIHATDTTGDPKTLSYGIKATLLFGQVDVGQGIEDFRITFKYRTNTSAFYTILRLDDGAVLKDASNIRQTNWALTFTVTPSNTDEGQNWTQSNTQITVAKEPGAGNENEIRVRGTSGQTGNTGGWREATIVITGVYTP